MNDWIFDLIVVAVIVVSAVMSLGRGLIREAFSVVSFIVGFAVGMVSLTFLEPLLRGMTAPNATGVDPVAAGITFGIGFLAAYIAAAFLGSRLSKLIHTSPEIGVLDRLAGAAFGIARGVLAAVLFILLMQQVIPENATPQEIAKSRSYPYLSGAASWIRSTVPGFVKSATEVIREPAPGEAG
jgi:membrane protein required for colicin V production